MKWYQRLFCGLLLSLSALLWCSWASATLSPEAQIARIHAQLKKLLVPAPAGWQMIRDYPRYLWLLRAEARLHPPHEAGWNCIHYREGSWADDGAPYYGGLQMSYSWMGQIRGQANWYSPLTQMWAAERLSAKYHFSYSWMKGQWPNTYPPCASYF